MRSFFDREKTITNRIIWVSEFMCRQNIEAGHITSELLFNPFSSTLFLIVGKWVYQNVQRHNPPFLIFDIRVYSGAQDWAPECPNRPECQKIKKGGLYRYGPEHFEVYPCDTTGLERVNLKVTCHKIDDLYASTFCHSLNDKGRSWARTVGFDNWQNARDVSARLYYFAAHCRNVTVLRTNIIFCDICCFSSANFASVVLIRCCKLSSFSLIFAVLEALVVTALDNGKC